jgi:hypothetical protein
MLPTTEVVGVPPVGFRPTTRHLVGGLHDHPRSHGEALPPLHHGAMGGLAHTALITGESRRRHPESEQGISHPPCGGQYRMYPASVGRFGTSLLSSVGAAAVGDSRLRGRITAARASGPVWTTHTTMTHALTHSKRTDSKPPAGHSAVGTSASDALSPTRSRVGESAIQLRFV